MLAFLFLIIAANVIILTKLVFLPYPELFVYPYLANNGLLPYGQIFDQHFPGFMFFPDNLGSLGIDSPGEMRGLHLVVVIATHLVLYLTAKKILKNNFLALGPNIFYLLWQPFFEGWVLWIDSFMPLLLLPAYYHLVKYSKSRASRDLVLAGLILGTALVFKQVVMPLIALAFLAVAVRSRKLKAVALFAFGVLIPVLAMCAYLAGIGVLKDFVFWTIEFNLTTFAEMGRKYASRGDFLRVGVIFGTPFLFACYSFLKSKKDEIFWAGLFFLSTLFFAYARFDPVHLQPALVFAALLAVFAVSETPKKFLAALLAVYLVPALMLLPSFYRSHQGSSILFFGDFERRLAKAVQGMTKPSDKIFAFAATPHIYYLAGRLPAGNVFAFPFPWFFKDAEGRILAGLIADPPKMILRERAVKVDGFTLVEHAPLVGEYIDRYYKLYKVVDNTEILIRK